MDACSRIIHLEQLSASNIVGCQSDLEFNDKGTAKHPVSGLKEIICPEPRRAKVPCTVDITNRFSCRTRRKLPFIKDDSSQVSQNSLDLFLNEVNIEDELNTSERCMGFYNCSPPVRANNPIVNDVHFISKSSVVIDFPSETSHQGRRYVSNGKEGVSHETSGRNPMVRIEGFACGDNEASCISSRA